MENDNAQPSPVDQIPTGTPAAAPDPAPQATPEPELTDPDLIELRDAQAAAKAEEAAAQAPGTEQVSGTPALTPPAAAGDQQPPAVPAAKAQMIPKPRLDQALRERDAALQQAAYHRGVAEARATTGQPATAQQSQPTAQTPEQRLAGIATEIDALAKKFDDGEITMSDFKKQERALGAREQTIREEALLAKVPQAKAPEGGGDTLYLDDVTTQLLSQHPWVAVFDQVGTKADWDYLNSTAAERLKSRGVELAPGALGSATLRREMAAVADELGPALLTSRAQAKGITLPGQPSPQSGQQQPPAKPPLSPVAANRLDKLTRAGNAPPDLSAMTGGNGTGNVPDSSIEHMSDDAIAALPAATLNRIAAGGR